MITSPYKDRIDKLTATFGNLGVDGVLVHDYTGVRYLSGFTGSHARLIISKARRVLYTDQRYTEQAALEAPGWEIFGCGINRLADLVFAIECTGISRLGFESETVTVAEHDQLASGLETVDLIPVGDLTIDIRAVKDAHEISCIRKALEVAENAFDELAGDIRPGLSEKEIAARLEFLMFRHGSEKAAFETIVACGTNTSKPHHSPGNDTVKTVDALLFDFGAQVNGYKSDITRMLYIGEEPEVFTGIRIATEKALHAAETAIRPGMTGSEADEAARDVFRSHDLEQYTLRGLGHGVGLAIHEWPRVVMESDYVLKPGMVCTLEPGVYIPGKAGVRLENLALITGTGAEILNTSPLVRTIKNGPGS